MYRNTRMDLKVKKWTIRYETDIRLTRQFILASLKIACCKGN